MADYEAKNYYRNPAAAAHYASQYHQSLAFSNMRARVFGRREEHLFLRMLSQANLQSAAVLDIASGTGRYVELLLKRGYQVTGVDVSAEMLGYARRRLGMHANLHSLNVGDAEKLPFRDDHFDLVSCIRLYHRIPKEKRLNMLREVQRVGRGKAILFFGMSTPWLTYRRALRSKIINGRNSNPHPVTREQLTAELESIGMTVLDSGWVLPLFASGLIVLVSWK